MLNINVHMQTHWHADTQTYTIHPSNQPTDRPTDQLTSKRMKWRTINDLVENKQFLNNSAQIINAYHTVEIKAFTSF